MLHTIASLGDKLGATLLQLPPNLRRDTAMLAAFLERLPAERRFASEFRHYSWLVDEVYDLLRAHDVALCSADVREERQSEVQGVDGPVQ